MNKNFMVIHDFTRMADAKSFALVLMDNGVQFAFCPHPISISHPPIAEQKQEDQFVKND